jgi:hypothetical protein
MLDVRIQGEHPARNHAAYGTPTNTSAVLPDISQVRDQIAAAIPSARKIR